MCLKSKVYKLSKKDDSLLLNQLREIKNKHGIISYETGESGIIFSGRYFRKSALQYPFSKVKNIQMSFNPDKIDCLKIRKIIESSKDHNLLIYRDEKGKLKDTIYIPKQNSFNSYEREVFYNDPRIVFTVN